MKLEPRTEKARKMTRKDLTPGVLYGKGIKSVPVQVNTNDFQKMLSQKGTSKTFEVTLEGKKHIVYIKETQNNFDNYNLKTHFDLVKVAAGDTMTSKINVVFLNHSEVEKRGLVVNAVLSTLEVEYGVGFGITKLELNVEGLNENDSLKVSDIVVPKGVKILEDANHVVVSVSAQKEEVQVDLDAEEVKEVESIKQSNE